MISKKTENPVTHKTLSSPPAASNIVGIPFATPYWRSCRFTREGTVTAGDNAPRMHLKCFKAYRCIITDLKDQSECSYNLLCEYTILCVLYFFYLQIL